MVTGKLLTGKDDLSQVFQIREEVFCKEQNIAKELERDAWDQGAIHVLIHDHGCNVATGRLLQKDGEYSIGRVAVIKEERGKYYGDLVVRMLVDKAFRLGAKKVVIHAQSQTVPFYQKIGFVQDGEECVIAGINHIPMKIEQLACSKCHKE